MKELNSIWKSSETQLFTSNSIQILLGETAEIKDSSR